MMSRIKEFYFEEPEEGYCFKPEKPLSKTPTNTSVRLMSKRQFLNTIIRLKPDAIKERWALLYYEYEKVTHSNIDLGIERHNKTAKSRIKSKLDYIDLVLCDLDGLYKVAQCLFRVEFAHKIKQYLDII